ncbi:MAG: PLP-dependent aminotransferase family protein [Desulfohalobiaceae bacterium]|nr:PLP-dependent aminotransferase family protein [Desulfohalobiaceae bacterium]
MDTHPLLHLYSSAAQKAQPSTIRDLCALVARPEIRSLAGGWPDPEVFPGAELSAIFETLMRERRREMFQYGSTEGVLELRQLIAEQLMDTTNLFSPDNLLITQGSAQGMSLACQVFLDPGDIVLVGLPTYFGGSGAVAARGGECLGVPLDGQGLDTLALDKKVVALKSRGRKVKGVYTIPTFQNPAGVSLSLERRQHLLELAAEHDLVIFEDDPYRDLRYEGEDLPSLLALDHESRVIHLRSLSKIFSPGMRLGWAAGHPGAIRKMAVAKQFADVTSTTPSQYMLLEFIKQGLLRERIETNRDFYRQKRNFMLEQLEKNFPQEVSWNRPRGGFFIFVHLPETWDAADLLREAVDRKVAFVTGQPFFVDGGGQNTLRLSFSQAGREEIEAAVKALGALTRDRLAAGF